jgi:uncharacterized protein (TIGR01777 family)
MKILISGASGFLGTALSNEMRADGHTVVRLMRRGHEMGTGDIQWDPLGATADVRGMEGMDAVVNLNGASISEKRWTNRRKRILRSSRLDATRLLVDCLSHLNRKPSVFVSASGTGFYGHRGDEILKESSGHGADFLSMLARSWEAEAARAEQIGIRTAMLRFGVILSGEGGALPKMIRPFRLGLGGRLGNGRQWLPWIALSDATGVIRTIIAEEKWRGAVNAVAPSAIDNSEFTRTLGRVLRRPAIFPVPGFALRLLLGEMADALLLASQRAVPERLLTGGYNFQFPELEPALRAMLKKSK